jgi:DNA-binding NarL/FixJ family response regulator
MPQRVLLAEDHLAVAEQLRALLSREYEVLEVVRDGLALVRAVKALAPDAIVADVGLPLMTGLTAARAILEEQPGARIVIVTVRDEAPVIRHALALGALGYVSKADAGEELLPAVRSSLEAHRYLSTTAREALGPTGAPQVARGRGGITPS